MRAIAVPLDGEKLSVEHRRNRPPPRDANVERLLALGAALLLPGERKTWHGQTLFLTEGGGLLSLLLQEIVDG